VFGLAFLVIVVLYIWLSKLGSKNIKKERKSFLLYWGLVTLLPIWFFVGHYIYPSYFEFQSLCESELVNTYTFTYDENVKSFSEHEWLVSNRLRKYTNTDHSGNVLHEYVSFKYYPYGTKATIMGLASGAAPSFSCSSKSNLTEFITSHINIVPSKKEEIQLEAKIIANFDLTNESVIERGRTGDIAWCDSKIVGKGFNNSPGLDVSYLVMVNPIGKKYNQEKTMCTDENIYIVSTPLRDRDYFQINIYDYQGINIKNLKYSIPTRNWIGYPRKPLIYFDKGESGMIIGIEEFGREIDSEYIFYILPNN